MDKVNYTAIFTEKATGRQLYILRSTPLNKFFWEKEKLMILEKITKDRFMDKHEIYVEDLGATVSKHTTI